jgi:membrane associated rhomboid family serine protease
MGVLPQKRNRNLLLGQEGNALVALIAISAIMFVLINFIKIGFYLGGLSLDAYTKNVLAWFVVPANPSTLLSRPWTIFTYMFTHDGVWHMISNMLWLWAFGFILQDLTGNKHIAPIYLYGGWMGAFMFMVTVNIFPVLQQQIASIAPMIGGGAAIMAVAVATTTVAPSYRLFPMLHGGIPLWVLTLIFVLVDYALIASVGAGVAVGHLAGGFTGIMYAKAMQRGSNWGEWMHQFYHWLLHMFDPKESKAAKLQQKQKLHYKAGPEPFKTKPNITQQRVDELLDKINTKGYHSLTDEEKDFLKRASKEEL